MSEPNQDVAIPETATESRQLANVWHYNPDMDFRRLALEAEYGSKGFRLVDKEDLVNVPHVIMAVTYRPGFPRGLEEGDYISIEAVVADKDTLASNPIRHMLPDELKVWGNEPVVYNDGSTGVRRQLTELFQQIGIIDVGKARKDENPYDRPYQQWNAGADLAVSTITADANGHVFRYVCPRGLRKSDYQWTDPGGKAHDATTYYIG